MPFSFRTCLAMLTVLWVTTAFGGPAFAADDNIINARQAAMKNLQNSLRVLEDATRGDLRDLKHDEEQVVLENARSVLSNMLLIEPSFRSQTPLGSRRTRSTEKIWTDWPAFSTEARLGVDAAQRLVDDIEQDNLRRLSDNFRAVAATCSSCHRKFRGRR